MGVLVSKLSTFETHFLLFPKEFCEILTFVIARTFLHLLAQKLNHRGHRGHGEILFVLCG